MARPLRSSIPNETYHVICRGNRRQPIFAAEEDYLWFYRLMEEGLERFDHQIIAFCLMTNHVHLVVQNGESDLSEVLHNLLFRYAKRFNWKHEVSGHVFEGRFKSKRVGTRNYMRGLVRYVHLNPVRARMVGSAEQYRWSSHNAYIGEEQLLWLSPSMGLECFGANPNERVGAYLDYLSYQLDHEDCFEFDREHVLMNLRSLLVATADLFGVQVSELDAGQRTHRTAEMRAVAALVAKRVKAVSLTELAEHFGQTPGAMSRAASRLSSKLPSSPALQERVDNLINQLT